MVRKLFFNISLIASLWLLKVNYVLATYDPCKAVNGEDGVNTALGCVPVTASGFISWLLSWLFGLAGGIAFVLMVYGFILLGMSSGDEKKVAGAKETITSAITGLLVSISALFILKLITIDILKIPGI
ncbi:MAG: hypothetical protein PHX34_03680 [Candidatus Shapirobacteria bacterium]|nr:hypothetical protein [Candidatus Shapirobacteria bacterium]